MLTFCRYLWSGILVGGCVSIFEILLILGFMYSGIVPHLVGEADMMDAELIDAAGKVLLLQGINWVITTAMSGFFVRALEPFGYFARLAWWGVIHLVICNTAPAIAVIFGATLLQAGVVMTTAAIVCYVPIYFDMFRLMKKQKIPFVRPSWSVGFRNFFQSTGVTGKLLLENARQQGVRLVLAPLSGAVALAAFATMRTGANVALQGLNTITNPLMPDLMRFLHGKDQVRSEAAFGTVWVVVVALIAPSVIILQSIAEPLFNLWTQHRITFDPTLFALLSLSVLIYAVAQPAVAVVLGNNLMRPQLMLSAISAIVVVGGIVIFVPTMGLAGAGFALVVGEIIAAFGYVYYAKSWLHEQGLRWPNKSFIQASISVIISGVAMGAMVLFPSMIWIICGASILLCGWNFMTYWLGLPPVVRERFYQILKSFRSKVRRVIPG